MKQYKETALARTLGFTSPNFCFIFECKVTKKYLNFQSFLRKSVLISVFFILSEQKTGENYDFMGKNKGRPRFCRRPPLWVYIIYNKNVRAKITVVQ